MEAVGRFQAEIALRLDFDQIAWPKGNDQGQCERPRPPLKRPPPKLPAFVWVVRLLPHYSIIYLFLTFQFDIICYASIRRNSPASAMLPIVPASLVVRRVLCSLVSRRKAAHATEGAAATV